MSVANVLARHGIGHAAAEPSAATAPTPPTSQQLAEALATATRLAELRRDGIVPAEYSTPAYCDGCGYVWLWPGLARIYACPWCRNRRDVRPIPRPRVTCAQCSQFRRSPHTPEVGLGTCAVDAPQSRRARALRPDATRICAAFHPLDIGASDASPQQQDL